MESLFSAQGRFEILSLSGSFLVSENGGHRSRTGGLSVSLAGPDGRVLGGSVAGLLTAASPVQVRSPFSHLPLPVIHPMIRLRLRSALLARHLHR